MKKAKRILPVVVLLVLALIVIWVLAFFIINRKELKTLQSFKKEAPVNMYSMTVECDYFYDEYLEEGFNGYRKTLNFIAERFMHGMVPTINIEKPNCSTFVCHNEKGEVLFCRNFDDKGEAACCFVTTEPDYGYKSICATDLSAIFDDEVPVSDFKGIQKIYLLAAPYFSTDGMNEHGVAISLLSAGRAVSPSVEGAITLSPYDVIRVVLENAKTVDEAVDLLHNYNIYLGSSPFNTHPIHYMIADASGKSVVVEFIKGELVTLESPIVTNFNVCGQFYGIGQERYDRIEQVLNENNGILNETQALALLEEVCMPGLEQYSIIYNLTTGEVTAFSKGDASVTANVQFFEK